MAVSQKFRRLFTVQAIPGWALFVWKAVGELSTFDFIRTVWVNVKPQMTAIYAQWNGWLPFLLGVLWLTVVVLWKPRPRPIAALPRGETKPDVDAPATDYPRLLQDTREHYDTQIREMKGANEQAVKNLRQHVDGLDKALSIANESKVHAQNELSETKKRADTLTKEVAAFRFNAANRPSPKPDKRLADLKNELAAKDKLLAEKDAALKQHGDAMLYGTTHFRPTPLLALDLGFLTERMTHLQPLVDVAGERLQGVMAALTLKLQYKGEDDPGYWLAEQIVAPNGLYQRLRACRERFNAEVAEGADSRESLALFLKNYEESRRWCFRMLGFLKIKLDSLPEAKGWVIANNQFVQAILESWQVPQFKALAQWKEWDAYEEVRKLRPDALP